jgi:hypothetical protein
MICTALTACGAVQVEVRVVDPLASPAATATAATSVPTATAMPTIVLTPSATPCPVALFFGTLQGPCPESDAQELSAAFQTFDGGYMVWEEGSGSVYVLYNDGSGIRIPEATIATWPDVAINELPPPNHFKPIRGFARVWTHEEAVRQRMGWPFGIEQAFTMQFQAISDRIFMSLPNGQIIEFTSADEWRVIR